MIERNPVSIVFGLLLLLAALDLLLLVSGYRILIEEELVTEAVVLPGRFTDGLWRSHYQCHYFTGRSVQTRTLSRDVADECQFIYSPYA